MARGEHARTTIVCWRCGRGTVPEGAPFCGFCSARDTLAEVLSGEHRAGQTLQSDPEEGPETCPR